MAYRFKAGDGSVTEGIRRIAAEEFAGIAAALADPALAPARKVHEARKGTKRLRALVRLTAHGFAAAPDEIAALRACAASLSDLRDRAALGEVVARLSLPGDTASTIVSALARRPMPPEAEQKRSLDVFAKDMAAIASRATAWSLDHDGWKAIGQGVRRGYTRFVQTMTRARRATLDTPVHDFRKRAKDHWYQTLLLRGIFPAVMDGYADAGEQLGDDLGDWRDLGLLLEDLSALPAHELPKGDAATSFGMIAKARRRALHRAFRTAERLTAETPDDYSDRVRAWWKAWR